MATPPGADRGRANRIRTRIKAGVPVDPEDTVWLTEYEDRQQKNRQAMGASAAKSSRVTYSEEHQEAVAVGTGSASELAASAMFAREEGRRLDSIIDRGINALVHAVATYEKITQALLKERQADAITHRALLESVRTHFVARTEAEAELIRSEAEHEAAAAQAAQSSGGSGIERAIMEMVVKNGFSVDTPTNGSGAAKKSD